MKTPYNKWVKVYDTACDVQQSVARVPGRFCKNPGPNSASCRKGRGLDGLVQLVTREYWASAGIGGCQLSPDTVRAKPRGAGGTVPSEPGSQLGLNLYLLQLLIHPMSTESSTVSCSRTDAATA